MALLARPECYIGALSDDVLISAIFSRLSLADMLRLDSVSRRWRRLVRESLWPFRTHLDAPTIIKLLGDLAGKKRSAVCRALFDRCAPYLTELDLSCSTRKTKVLPYFASYLKNGAEGFGALKHLALGDLLKSLGTYSQVNELLEAVASQHSTLNSLALLDLPIAPQTAPVGRYFTRFRRLELLQVSLARRATVDKGSMQMTGLPSTLKYLELRCDSTDEMDDWLRVASRDCVDQLETLRIVLACRTSGEYLDPKLFVAPSPKAIRLISNLKRLTALQIPLRNGSASCEALADVLSPKLSCQLRALSITNLPSLKLLALIAERCGQTLQHLSLRAGDTRGMQREVAAMPEAELNSMELCFPSLLSWKHRELSYSWLLAECMYFEQLKRIHSFLDYYTSNEKTIEMYFFKLRLSVLACSLTLDRVHMLSETLEEYWEQVETARVADEHARGAPLTYCPTSQLRSLTKPQYKLRCIPHVRVVRDLPPDESLETELFGSRLALKPKFLLGYFDHW